MPRQDRRARGALPPAGVLVVDDDGSRVQCHVCGVFVRGLGIHVNKAHGLNADAYRERYGLNRTQPLAAPELQARLAQLHGAHLARVRPAGNIMDRLTREQVAASSSRPRRAQMRRQHAEAMRRYYRLRPAPSRPPRPALPLAERLARANARRAQLLADPAWRARWIAAISVARRRPAQNCPTNSPDTP